MTVNQNRYLHVESCAERCRSWIAGSLSRKEYFSWKTSYPWFDVLASGGGLGIGPSLVESPLWQPLHHIDLPTL